MRFRSDRIGGASTTLVGVALALCTVGRSAAQQSLSLETQETAGIRRFQYPVAVRLRFPEPVPRASGLRLLRDSQPVLAQFRPAEPGDAVAEWWLDFPVDLLPYQTQLYRVEYGAPLPDGPSLKRGHKLVESAVAFEVVNEPAIAWTVDRKMTGLLQSVRSGDLEYLRPDSLGLLLTDDSGREHRAGDGGDVTARVIRNGPLAVALRFELVEKGPALAGVRSTVDLLFPVFKSWVEVDWRVDDPQHKAARLGAHLNTNLSEPTPGLPTLVDFGATSLVYVSVSPGQSAVLRSAPVIVEPKAANAGARGAWDVLRGPSDQLKPFVNGPRQSPPGTYPEGWLHAMDRQRCLALAVDRFARDSHDQLSVTAAGDVRLQRAYSATAADEWPPARHLRFWLHFVPFPPQQTAATSPQAMQNQPAVRVRMGTDR